MRSLLLAALVPALGAAVAATPALMDPPKVEVKEWKVPWEKSRPRDPYVDPTTGRIWFVGQAGNYVGHLDQEKGTFKRFEIDSGTYPHNVIVDGQGHGWYAGNRNGMIGRIDPATGKITRYPMPDPAVKDPHTLVFDRSGDIWFTAQQSAYVGKLTTSTGKIQLVRTPEGSRPYGIVIDSKNRPWFNLFGTNKLATVDPATMALKTFDLPHDRARGRRIALTSDDRVWYVDYTRGFLGVLDPKTSAVREWAMPSGAPSMPYAMTVDDRDRLWAVESGVQPNKLVSFDSKSETWVSTTAVPSGGLTVRHMVFDPKTREIWFGTDAGTIGRAKIDD